jgi:hypothetical protein
VLFLCRHTHVTVPLVRLEPLDVQVSSTLLSLPLRPFQSPKPSSALHSTRRACDQILCPMPQYTPDKWIEQLMKCQHLPEADMKILCDRVRCILMEESNIQPVSSPVTICGDVHGQFWDVLELLRKGGEVPETSYIFMARMCWLGFWSGDTQFPLGGFRRPGSLQSRDRFPTPCA